MRRILFTAIPSIFADLQGLEVVSLLWMQTFYMIWYWHNKPHVCRERRNLEYINEAHILMSIYHVAIFTYWCKDNQQQFHAGYSFVFVLGFLAYINIQHMLRKNVDKTRQKYRLAKQVAAYREYLLLQLREKAEKKRLAAERKAKTKALRQAIRERIEEDMGPLPEVYRPIVALADFITKYKASEERVTVAMAKEKEQIE